MENLMTRFLMLGALLLMIGCSGQKLVVDPVIEKPSPVSIPVIQPLTLNSVQWKVLNISDLKALVARLSTENNQNTILFALDIDNYQNLGLNFVEIKRFLVEQKAIIVLLKKIIDQQSGIK